eukprot:COSAG01_NODE_4551_length_4930_cov_75.171807_7_plen_74_part_01
MARLFVVALVSAPIVATVAAAKPTHQVFTIDDTPSAPIFTTAGAEAGLMFDMDLLFQTTLIHTPGKPPRQKWGW